MCLIAAMFDKKLPFCIIANVLVIYSVCSQIQLLGALINFNLLWQKAFLT